MKKLSDVPRDKIVAGLPVIVSCYSQHFKCNVVGFEYDQTFNFEYLKCDRAEDVPVGDWVSILFPPNCLNQIFIDPERM